MGSVSKTSCNVSRWIISVVRGPPIAINRPWSILHSTIKAWVYTRLPALALGICPRLFIKTTLWPTSTVLRIVFIPVVQDIGIKPLSTRAISNSCITYSHSPLMATSCKGIRAIIKAFLPRTRMVADSLAFQDTTALAVSTMWDLAPGRWMILTKETTTHTICSCAGWPIKIDAGILSLPFPWSFVTYIISLCLCHSRHLPYTVTRHPLISPSHIISTRWTHSDGLYHTLPSRICISQPCISPFTTHCFFALLTLLICHICTDYYFSHLLVCLIVSRRSTICLSFYSYSP